MRLFFLALTLLITVSQSVSPPANPAEYSAATPTAQAVPPAEPNPSHAELACASFTALFEDPPNYFPENVRVLGVRLREGSLTVNLSKEFLNYGGSENELVYIETLKETARGIPGVTSLTVLIEGLLSPLAEGSVVSSIPL